MALTSADLARLWPQAQKQVLDKLAGTQKPKKSKYGNRKVVRDGIKFDSEREAARFTELKVLRAMGRIRDLRLQVNFTLVEGLQDHRGETHQADGLPRGFCLRASDRAGLQRHGVLAARGRGREGRENEGLSAEKETDAGQVRHHDPRGVR